MVPDSALVHGGLVFTLQCAGRPKEALSLFEKAIRLSPIPDSRYVAVLGYCYFDMDHYEEIITSFKKYRNHNAEDRLARASLAAAYIMLGREEEARNEVAEVLRLDPNCSVEGMRKRSLYKNPEDVKHLYGAMLKAGLPE